MTYMKIIFLTLLVLSASISSCKKNVVVCDGATPSYQSDIKQIIDNNCVSCHSSYSTYNGVKSAVSNGTFEKEVVTRKTMPQNGTLSADQLNLIRCWLDNNAPEN